MVKQSNYVLVCDSDILPEQLICVEAGCAAEAGFGSPLTPGACTQAHGNEAVVVLEIAHHICLLSPKLGLGKVVAPALAAAQALDAVVAFGGRVLGLLAGERCDAAVSRSLQRVAQVAAFDFCQ